MKKTLISGTVCGIIFAIGVITSPCHPHSFFGKSVISALMSLNNTLDFRDYSTSLPSKTFSGLRTLLLKTLYRCGRSENQFKRKFAGFML